MSCDTIGNLQWAAAGFAAIAAALWLAASLIRLPKDSTAFIMGDFAVGGTDELIKSLKRQSRLNALGAASACVAAGLQAILIKMPTCINLG